MNKKDYCIIGIDVFTLELAKLLEQQGMKVVLIDDDMEKVQEVSDSYPYVYKLDPMHIPALESVNISEFDTIIVGLKNMEESIVTISNLKKLNIKRIIARADTEVQKNILELIGGESIEVVWLDGIVSRMLGYSIVNDVDLNLFTKSNRITILKIKVTNEKLFGWPISKFEFKNTFLTTIISIEREDELIFPVHQSIELLKDDVLTIAFRETENTNIKDFISIFK